MQLKVLPVEASDIRELAIAGIEAFQNPLQTLLLAVYPPFENEGAEIEWHIKRLTRDFESQTPPKIWVKVVDADANNKIVGAARWLIYADASPFADRKAANPEEGWSAEKQTGGTAQEPPSLFDFPAGSIEERFATQGYGQIAAGRKQYADRPQICLSQPP